MLEAMMNPIGALGYFGIFLLVFVAPTPPELVMPFAGFLVAQGRLSFPYVLLAGVTGCVASTSAWYLAGRYVGEERLRRWLSQNASWLKLPDQEVVKAKAWFNQHGGQALFFSRVVPGVRSVIALPAGISGMRALPFLLYVTSGAILWHTVLTYAGYKLGGNYGLIAWYLGPVGKILAFVLLVALIVWAVRRRK